MEFIERRVVVYFFVCESYSSLSLMHSFLNHLKTDFPENHWFYPHLVQKETPILQLLFLTMDEFTLKSFNFDSDTFV